jgi:hypothetical protein
MEKCKFVTLPGLELWPFSGPERSQLLYRLCYRGFIKRVERSTVNERKLQTRPRQGGRPTRGKPRMSDINKNLVMAPGGCPTPRQTGLLTVGRKIMRWCLELCLWFAEGYISFCLTFQSLSVTQEVSIMLEPLCIMPCACAPTASVYLDSNDPQISGTNQNSRFVPYTGYTEWPVTLR